MSIKWQSQCETTALNILKGFFACSLISTVPVELYRFCISLQDIFAHDLAGIGAASLCGAERCSAGGAVQIESGAVTGSLLHLALLIAFAYCTIKIFFQNIKRGGILLVQIAVGSLYMFSVPRGYADGFSQWVRQVLAICLTAFCRRPAVHGAYDHPEPYAAGLGIMLSANEVPRIAQQFGLDSSVRVNMMSVVHTTSTAVNLARSVGEIRGQRNDNLYLPKDMKAKANLWLWSLWDFVILGIALLLSAVLLVQFGLLPPAAMTLCFGFLTIRLEDVTVLDFLRWAGQYFYSASSTTNGG